MEKFVLLPVLYDSWPHLRDDLKSLAGKTIRGLDALEEVLVKNDRSGNIHLPLTLLRSALNREQVCTLGHFCDVLLPWMACTALNVEHLFRDSEYKLKSLQVGQASEVVLTRQQVCCLLCLAFFNSFKPAQQQGRAQRFTLSELISSATSKSQRNKLLCLLNYFERIRQSEEAKEEEFLSMCVCISRKQLDPWDTREARWESCEKPLLPFESQDDGTIESAHGCLQVDFANASIGGGVLRRGCVQEEIRFVINPECLVSILFCEKMSDCESILITGTDQFSLYKGYSRDFTYTGPCYDTRKCRVSIVAMDATRCSGSVAQFEKRGILRELNKAYCGFTHRVAGDDPGARTLAPVATGNWGCGAFGGDKRLKTLIQWLAASRAGRTVKYYAFKDTGLCQQQRKMVEKVLQREVTVGKLYSILVSDSQKRDVFGCVVDVI